LDDLDRSRLDSGDLARLVAAGVRGVTTNPAIFEKAVSSASGAYETALRECAERGMSAEQAVTALTTDDVRRACDVLAPLWRSSGGEDGWVSIEVDPRLARDPDGTLAAARTLVALVDRPNVLIKVPATVECLPAISACLSAGISVNVTLIFSVDRYREVLEAWLSGLEGAILKGVDVSGIHSVASFFVSRVDSLVDGVLQSATDPQARSLLGTCALANARLAWAEYERCLGGARWAALAAAGAPPQRPLWASTGVKNPDYDPVMYVRGLVGRGCVNTMPEATLVASSTLTGPFPDTVSGREAEAEGTWRAVEDFGLSRREVLTSLEEAGITLFVDAWTETSRRSDVAPWPRLGSHRRRCRFAAL
jgi:transaldolase